MRQLKAGSYECGIKRAGAYTISNPCDIVDIFIPSKKEVSTMYTIGVAGAAIGLVGGGVGAMIGVGTTTVVVYGSITIDKLCYIRRSFQYLAWSNERDRLLRNAAIERFLKVDDQLKYMLCPISHTIPLMPVRLRGKDDGLTCEYEKLRELLTANAHAHYPGTKCEFTIDNLVFDFAHVNTMRARIYQLIETLYELNPATASYKLVNSQVPNPLTLLVMEYLTNLDDDRGSALINHCIRVNKSLNLPRISAIDAKTSAIMNKRQQNLIDNQTAIAEFAKLNIAQRSKKVFIDYDKGFFGFGWFKDIFGMPRNVQTIVRTEVDDLLD